jgi:hypothetical protein
MHGTRVRTPRQLKTSIERERLDMTGVELALNGDVQNILLNITRLGE